MTKSKQDKKAPLHEPDLASTLTLISLMKSKASEQRSGWALKFTAPIDNAEMDSDDESEIKRPLHGVLTLTRTSLFPDPEAPQTPEAVQKALREKEKDPQNGNVKMVFTGKLKRRYVGARKETPAYSIWNFSLSNRPQASDLKVLMDMASADGYAAEASVQAEFSIKAESKGDEPQGPELFEESDKDEMSEEDKKIMDGDFDQGAESNKLPTDPKTGEFIKPEDPDGELMKELDAEKKSVKRKRKVEAGA